MAKQVDVFHPLVTLDWQQCSSLPENVQVTACVWWRDKIYVSTFVKSHPLLYMTSDLKLWTAFDIPIHRCTLTTYKSQLMLIGGREISTGLPTNKLWTSNTGMDWQPSDTLPPIPIQCNFPSVVNTRSPEYLIVAGDVLTHYMTTGSGRVQALIEGQWWAVPNLPSIMPKYRITLHNRKLYFTERHGVCHHCDLNSLVISCTQPEAKKKHPQWKKLPMPNEASRHLIPSRLISLQQHLFYLQSKIFAYLPLSQSWVCMGSYPRPRVNCSLVLPTADCVVFTGSKVFRGTFKSSAYDPNSQFDWSALCKLYAAGFEVKRHGELAAFAGWMQNGRSVTWRSYHTFLRELHLKELSQQIEEHVSCARSLKEQCTSVIISALLQQTSLEHYQLHINKLPDYVPTMVKHSITHIIKAHYHDHELKPPAPLPKKEYTPNYGVYQEKYYLFQP